MNKLKYKQDGVSYQLFPEFSPQCCAGCAFSSYDEDYDHDCLNEKEANIERDDKTCYQRNSIYCTDKEAYITAKMIWRLEGSKDED